MSRHSSASLIGHVPVKGRERGREEREGQMKEEGQREDEREDEREDGRRVEKSKVPYILRFYTEQCYTVIYCDILRCTVICCDVQ